jgi:hypothetical protein
MAYEAQDHLRGEAEDSEVQQHLYRRHHPSGRSNRHDIPEPHGREHRQREVQRFGVVQGFSRSWPDRSEPGERRRRRTRRSAAARPRPAHRSRCGCGPFPGWAVIANQGSWLSRTGSHLRARQRGRVSQAAAEASTAAGTASWPALPTSRAANSTGENSSRVAAAIPAAAPTATASVGDSQSRTPANHGSGDARKIGGRPRRPETATGAAREADRLGRKEDYQGGHRGLRRQCRQ